MRLEDLLYICREHTRLAHSVQEKLDELAADPQALKNIDRNALFFIKAFLSSVAEMAWGDDLAKGDLDLMTEAKDIVEDIAVFLETGKTIEENA
jgi:hypothetical protein